MLVVARLSIQLQYFWSGSHILRVSDQRAAAAASSPTQGMSELMNGAESSQKDQATHIGCQKFYKFVSLTHTLVHNMLKSL